MLYLAGWAGAVAVSLYLFVFRGLRGYYATWLFTAAFGYTFDLVASHVLGLYQYQDPPLPPLVIEVLLATTVYPLEAVLFLHWRRSWPWLPYLAAWATALTAIEWLFLHLGRIYFVHWHLGWSFLFYAGVFPLIARLHVWHQGCASPGWPRGRPDPQRRANDARIQPPGTAL